MQKYIKKENCVFFWLIFLCIDKIKYSSINSISRFMLPSWTDKLIFVSPVQLNSAETVDEPNEINLAWQILPT